MPDKKITLYQITFPSLKHLVLMLTNMPGTLNRTLASNMPWGSPAGFIWKKIFGEYQIHCHLCNHEVVIDVLQVAITTRTNGLVQLSELGVESGELLPDGKKKNGNLYFGQGLCL